MQAEEADPGPVELRATAIEQILKSARSDDPFLRANALEAVERLPGRATPLLQLGLQDEHPAVRFAALATIGKMQLEPLAPACRRLLGDASDSVRAAAMFALARCGDEVDLTPMASMLASQDPAVRGNAAMLVGLLGDASAVAMLRDLAKVTMPRVPAVRSAIVRIQFAEAMARLGDTAALDAIRAGAYSPFDEVRVLAVQIAGRLGDRRMAPAFAAMLETPPIELQLAAAEALARFGDSSALPRVVAAAKSSGETVRAQAAMTLGLFPQDEAMKTLATLLADESEQVRLGAAAAVLTRPAGD